MTKTISKKELYRKLKIVSDEVMQKGVIYTVLQNSKPAFYITPIDSNPEKKYRKEDLFKFVFAGRDKNEKNLALHYKKYLYK